jgi:hypothetical protein
MQCCQRYVTETVDASAAFTTSKSNGELVTLKQVEKLAEGRKISIISWLMTSKRWLKATRCFRADIEVLYLTRMMGWSSRAGQLKGTLVAACGRDGLENIGQLVEVLLRKSRPMMPQWRFITYITSDGRVKSVRSSGC